MPIINPYFKYPGQVNSFSDCVQCPPDSSLMSIVFDCKNVSVLRGVSTKMDISLEDFFIPIENFIETEFILKSSPTPTLISFGNINVGTSEKVRNLLIISKFSSSTPYLNQFIYWSYKSELDAYLINNPSGPSLPTGPTGPGNRCMTPYKTMGKMMFLTAGTSDDCLIEPIYLKNTQENEVLIKILIAS